MGRDALIQDQWEKKRIGVNSAEKGLLHFNRFRSDFLRFPDQTLLRGLRTLEGANISLDLGQQTRLYRIKQVPVTGHQIFGASLRQRQLASLAT